MAQHKLKTEWQIDDSPAAQVAAASPARMLQQLLDERTVSLPEPHVDRWSNRRALAFIVGSSCALWLAILTAGAQIVRAIA